MTARKGSVAGVLVLVALAAAPFVTGPVGLGQLQKVFVLAVALIGLNVLTGMTGQISVGHGAFLGIGAYTAVLTVNAGHHYATALVLAAVVAGGVGLVCGLPALRIKGMYLAMVTLGLSIVFPQIVIKYSGLTAGSAGLTVEQPMPVLLSGSALASGYWVLLIILALALWCFANMTVSRLGRSLIGVQDKEVAAATVGVPVARVKVVAYGVSAAISGVAGWMFVVMNGYVSPADFTTLLSINLLLALVIGGKGRLWGPVLGAAFLTYAEDWISSAGVDSLLTPALLGVVVILVLYFMPQGVAGLLGRGPVRRSLSSVPPSPTTDPSQR
ncbi:branched-chain amino acid ABC transporter permease [Pimelobacter simplex]|uniref:branched-chain amino acid ABC transporter permease n=1 Tax=Nocardioides simplex TaxID=2045 RepID=UPI003AAB1B2D